MTVSHLINAVRIIACIVSLQCSVEEVGQFQDTNSCLPQGSTSDQTYQCMDPTAVTVNSKHGMSTSNVDDMVCVVIDNNPSKGTFISDPGPQSELIYSKVTLSYTPI